MKKTLIIFWFLALPIQSFAIINYVRLHVSIRNDTPHICQLINEDVVHGSLIYFPPHQIYPNDIKHFDLEEGFLGPEINLVYRCGEVDSGYKNIGFMSRKNVAIIMAGRVSGKILAKFTDPGITAIHTENRGSTFMDKHGTISWIIRYT